MKVIEGLRLEIDVIWVKRVEIREKFVINLN